MDLYVERQYVEQLKQGDNSKFLLLFEEYFRELYLYVFRRVGDRQAVEEIVRMTFLDGLSQVQNVPVDTGFLVWLYSLAKPRVWRYLEKNGFPSNQGVFVEGDLDAAKRELFEKAAKVFGKLSLEEREIVRLKFFEEVADGDVMAVLGADEGAIGTKIYRVLKRVHFLIFGESDEGQAVYFGELSGFLARLRELELIEVPEVFRLSLRADLSARIDRQDFAVEVEEVEEKVDYSAATGSNDPAKIFVEAVREMREEEKREERKEEEVKEEVFVMEDNSAIISLLKRLAVVVPVVVLLIVVWIFAARFLFDGKVERGFSVACGDEVVIEGDFSDLVKRSIYHGVADPICEHFDEEAVRIAADEEGKLRVEVDLSGALLKYDFVGYKSGWKIKKYERVIGRNEESGEA